MRVLATGAIWLAVAARVAAAGSAPLAGSAACAPCHEAAYAAWSSSLHAHAARVARPEDVLAPFDGQRIEGKSAAAVVGQRGHRLTIAPAGGAAEPVALALGRAAVEQYLLPMSRGRFQAFPLAYDPRVKEWFDVFPEAPARDAWTHWQNPGATANVLCLDCHVTGFRKGFDAARATYATRWHEAGVGCEACHGAGAAHVAAGGAAPLPAPRAPETVCAPCHSLRIPLTDTYQPGDDLAQHFDFELLDSEAYWADGQLRDEAYEWTSFRLSRMAAAGVGCGDCHEPHGARLRAEGDALCLRCHVPELATPVHTHHPPGTAGSTCVGCHMPEHVFMERDGRRDHAFTRPDPQRSATIDAPDACTICHADRERAWAIGHAGAWWGDASEATRAQRALATILEGGRRGSPEAAGALAQLVGSGLDELRRASAARLLAPLAGMPAVRDRLRAAAADSSPFVRAGVVRALAGAADDSAVRDALAESAGDPTRLVRLEAAFALAGIDATALPAPARDAVTRAFVEWAAAQDVLADRPEAEFNRAIFWTARGDAARAEASYRRAVALWPSDPVPRQNLALLLAEAGRTTDAEHELREILGRQPEWPPARFALGVLRAGEGRWQDAIAELERCLHAAPDYPQAAYRLALAHREAGDSDAALAVLERAADEPSARRDALRELVRLHYERGDEAAVRRWLPLALAADPTVAGDPRVAGALTAMAPGAPPRDAAP